MREGLFKRYIVIFAATLLSCTLLLGIAQLYFSARNFTDDKQKTLHAASDRAVVIAQEGYQKKPEGDVILASVYDGFKSIYDTNGVTVFLTDTSGKVIACSEGTECTHTTKISERALNTAIRKGSYSSAGYFEGFFRQRGSYTYGVPLRVGTEGGEGDIVGFVFVSMPITPLFTHLVDMSLTFLISAGAMMLVAAVIIFFATRKLITPLSEISSAARDFGSGDFSARVNVTGNDEIAKLANSFNAMADSLTEYETMRRSFVANVSHELRTPMTTIGGYIDGILDKTIPPEREAYYLSVVSDEVKRLSRLTTSLLNISRFEEGAYTADIVCGNVWDVVIQTMSSMERRFTDKSIQVPDLETAPAFALCDLDMLHQVLYNMLDNAIKFTPEGGTIEVRVAANNGQVAVSVYNTGEGIPPEELGHIFERFYKTDKSRGLDRTGTGLGLYIARSLAQKMNGELTAQSEYGSWAQFTVTLPSCVPDKKQLKEAKSQTVRRPDAVQEKPDKSTSRFKRWSGFKLF